MKKNITLGLGILTWLGMILLFNIGLFKYEKMSGRQIPAPSKWPAESALKLASPLSTLVMFAHPKCPCMRASVGELERLMAQLNGKLHVYVVMLVPTGFSSDWAKTDIYETLRHIPGVTVFFDHNGTETSRFGALTAGFTVLYGPDGFLLFDGGITVGRGHSGINPGILAIKQQLEQRELFLVRKFSVFGCSLVTPETAKRLTTK